MTNPTDRPARRRPLRRRAAVRALAAVCAAAALVCATAPPAAAQGGGLGSVTVDLSEQHAYLYRPDGALAARVPVSTGRGGRTPVGRFAVRSKQRVGTAGSDPSVHMDYFTRFRGGVGFHGIPWSRTRARRLATPLGRYPVSHGCVRMGDLAAAWIYNELPVGAPVTVQR